MSSGLTPLNLSDFTGGLNERATPVGLADNESSDMLNIEVDPRLGLHTRKGWDRWNQAAIVDDPATWNPRLAKLHTLADGTYFTYVANGDGRIFQADQNGNFAQLTADGSADPHIADFAAWGDDMWIARGFDRPGLIVQPSGTEIVTSDASTSFNDDYTQPSGAPTMPQAEFAETHAGYMFVAGTQEFADGRCPNRIRWSHPARPDNWATLDFLDIDRGGGRITGLVSFGPALLIFKTDSMWALYGYDLASWQLEEVSTSTGLPHVGALARSETAVYFFSRADLNGVYAYGGQGRPVHISESLKPMMEQITDFNNVFVGWGGKRLWVSTSYQSDVTIPIEPFNAPGDDTYVWDPEIGNGAWIKFRPAAGSLGPFVARSDVAGRYPMAVMRGDTGTSCVVRLEYREDARDRIFPDDPTFLTDAEDAARLTDVIDGFQLTDGTAVIEGAVAFQAHYRTGWKHGGWPERRKSWLRPRYILQVPPATVLLLAEAYWDYDTSRVRRASLGRFSPDGSASWRQLGAADPNGDGFDWGDGTLWGGAASGSSLERSTIGLGVNRAVSIKMSSDPTTLGVPWAIESIHLKYRLREYTT